MSVSLTSLLCLLIPVLAVVFYFHLECAREREERLRNKFHPEYQPELTDCQAEIEFFNTEAGQVSVTLGNFVQSSSIRVKVSVSRSGVHSVPVAALLLGEDHHSSGRWVGITRDFNRKYYEGRNMIAGFEDVRHNVTIHDARNIPDNFHEAGFTLIKLDEVNNKYIDTPDLCKKIKNAGTGYSRLEILQ